MGESDKPEVVSLPAAILMRLAAEARAKADAGKMKLELTIPLKVWRSLGLGGAWVVESDWVPQFATQAATKAQALQSYASGASQIIIQRAAVRPVAAKLAEAAPLLVGALAEVEWIDGVCPHCRRNEYLSNGHHTKGCPVDRGLSAAGLETQEQRDEARLAWREAAPS